MHYEMEFDQAASSAPVANAACNVVIAYQEPEAARHAMRLVDRLGSHLSGEVEIHRDLWRFDVLDLPAARAEAGESASDSSLLVVCADRDGELSATVMDWLEAWSSSHAPGTAALVALLTTREEQSTRPSSTFRFLEATARRAGQDFFAQTCRLPSTNDSFHSRHARPYRPLSDGRWTANELDRGPCGHSTG